MRMAKKMVEISAGEFMMGALDDDKSADEDNDERPRHQGDIDSRFLDWQISGDTGVVGKCDGFIFNQPRRSESTGA